MGKGDARIRRSGERYTLELLPEYLFFFFSEFLKFCASTRHHSWRSAEIVFFIILYIFWRDPVSYVSLERCWIFWTRGILDIFEVLKSESYFHNLRSIEYILLTSYSEYKSYIPTEVIDSTTGLHLTKYGSKACPRTDKALALRSILEDKVPKWDESTERAPYCSITYNGTSPSVWYPLYYEDK